MDLLESKNNKGRQQREKYGYTREKEQQRETTTRKVWIYQRARTTKGDNNQKSMDLLERKNNKGKQQPEKYGFTREKEQQRETTTRKVWIYQRARTTKGDNNHKSMDLLERKNNKGRQQPEKYGFTREKEQQREITTRKVWIYQRERTTNKGNNKITELRTIL